MIESRISFFMKMLASLSVSGALLMLFILALSRLCASRVSRRWQYYIWAAAVLRFLLPLTPDTAVTGVLFDAAKAAFVREYAQTQPAADASAGNEGAGSRAAESASAGIKETERSAAGSAGMENAERRDNGNADIFLLYLFGIWAAGALASVAQKITAYQRFMQELKAGNTAVLEKDAGNLLSECKKKLHIKKAVGLYENPFLHSPVMAGVLHPRILLPAGEIAKEQLFYIFLHELTHVKRRDVFYKQLVQSARCIYWFHPFLYLLEKEVNKACELSCDEAVIALLDDSGRRAYGDTLLSFVRTGPGRSHSYAPFTLSEGARQLKERLGAIMNYRKKSKTAAVLLTMSISICFHALGAYAAPRSRSTAGQEQNLPDGQEPADTKRQADTG